MLLILNDTTFWKIFKWAGCCAHGIYSMYLVFGTEEAKQIAANLGECSVIYTDGLSYQEGVGAAAVLEQQQHPPVILQYHLGSNRHHMVFNAELVAILLVMHLVATKNLTGKIVRATDNQAAI